MTARSTPDGNKTATMKFWQKVPYLRIESFAEGSASEMIIHPDALYLYDSSQDKYLKMSFEKIKAQPAYNSLKDQIEQIRNNKAVKVLGTEIIDGKLATIIEYPFVLQGVSIRRKTWIWNEKGIPLRTEETMKMGETAKTTKIELSNFVFEDIPDSVFEVSQEKILE